MREGKICVGIIGLQGYGGTYFAVLARLPWVKITAICDTKKEVLLRSAQQHNIQNCYTDYRELLGVSEIDAVLIATPHFLHHQMTMDALEAGKHVFCEKPLAMNSREAGEMTALAEEKGLRLSCHYNRRQSALVKLLKDVVQRRILGEVYAVNIKWMARYTPFLFSPDSAWRTEKAKAGGGILIGRGSHMIDAVLYMLGCTALRSVSANVASRLTGLEIDDYCLLVMRMENGAMVTIEASYENNIPQYEERIEYQLFGTKAGAYCTEENGKEDVQIGYCKFPDKEWVDLSGKFKAEEYRNKEPVNMIEDFLNSLRDGRAPSIDKEEAAYVTAIIDMAYRSAEEGREMVWEDPYVPEGV